MDILFLNLPYEFMISRASRWPEKTKSGTLYYPYWISYCVGVCEEQGFDCKLVDCITKEYTVEDTINEVKSSNPDFVMCEITTPTSNYDYKTITEIKKANPNVKIIVGGTHATILPEEVLTKCPEADFVVRQEYDFTVPELVNAIKNGEDLSQVKGISYRNDKEIIHNPDCELTDLDKLPFVSKVYQKYLNVNDYSYALAQNPMIQIVASRGCPNQCNFCSYPSTMGGRLYRTRSVKDLADEFEYILTEMPEIKEIFIEDDTFTVDQKRVS